MKINMRIQWNKAFIIFLLFPFLAPNGIEGLGQYVGGVYYYIDKGFTYLTLISCVIVCLFYFGRKKIKLSNIMTAILFYLTWLITSAFINGNITFGYFITNLKIFGICMLTDYYMHTNHKIKYLESACSLLEVIILLNFICIIIFPDYMYVDDRGWGGNWLLGYKNLHIYYFVPYLAIKAITQYINKTKLTFKYYFMLAIILASTILANSTTSLIIVCVMTICILLFKNSDLPKAITAFNTLCVSAIFSAAAVFGLITNISQNIENFFGRDTLYLRSLIWSESLLYIAKEPIFGKGNLSFEIASFSWEINQAHNKFVDLFLTGGVVGVVLFFAVFWIASKNISEINRIEFKNIVLFSFILYALLFLVEARRNDYLFFMILVIAYYLPQIIEYQRYESLECASKRKNRLKIHIV